MLAVLEAARQGRVREHDKVDRFVLGTSRNVAARMREVEARARPLPEEGDGDGEQAVSSFEVSFERLDTAALHRCVSKLEERMRTVLALSFIEERRAEEIAAVLSTSAGNVRVLRHRALFALRGCLDGGAS
jgi:RNA polymerase sigma factor (sigma-70 family)